jgi:metal transporter CNNM
MASASDFFLVFVLILLSAICSGLNIAIMSLSLSELRRKAELRSRSAKRVLPLRENVHLTLAGILLANVAFASGAAIVLGNNFNGFIAVAISSLLLVVFAELLPQALFSKKALVICSVLSPLMKFFIIITYPISKPLQIALDKIFGSTESSKLHTRRELGLMINEHLGEEASELDEDEVEIIKGALQLSEKQVGDIMTPIESTYWLRLDTVLNPEKIDEIKSASYSRIPIFNAKKTRCHGVLLMKEMVDIDFDEKIYKVGDFKLHPTKTVGSRTALDTMFRRFIGARSHLIPVEKNDQIVGIVTIEDLIEEIIGHEIIDESDHAQKRT